MRVALAVMIGLWLLPAPASGAMPVSVQTWEGAQSVKAKAKTARKAEPAKDACTEQASRGGRTYVECEPAPVTGQPLSSGAITLEERVDLPPRTMVRQRTSFRDQIVKDVLSE
jgi:hypothetical protein